MRLLKMLGLGVVAVLVMMALAASSASAEGATWLCKNASGACEQVSHVHFLSVVANASNTHVDGKIKLLSSTTIECELLILGDVISNGTSPAKILADKTYTNCNTGCTVTDTAGGASIHGVFDILRLGTEQLADVIGLGFELKLTCPFIFTCDYNSEGLTGHGLPLNNLTGNIPHITYSGATINLTSKLSGPFNCPTTGALDALLKSLELFYIRASS